MVTCKSCLAENSIDSLFCRKCGVAIAEDSRSDAQQKLQELLAEGYRIFNEGRTDEARLVAEAALADEPDSTAALSLKGMCHERVGEIAEALAVYERVVERNPDSALDKIKVAHLRQSLAGKTLAEPAPTRARAILAGVAAVVLVVAIGIALAAAKTPKQSYAAQKGQSELASGTTDVFPDLKSQPEPSAKEPVPVPNGVQPNPGDGGIVANPPPTVNNTGRTPPIRLPKLNGSILPRATDETGNSGEEPVIPNAPTIRVEPQSKPNPPGERDTGPDPVIDPNSGGRPDQKKPDFDPGFIDIKVSKPKSTPGGSQDLPDSNGVDALLKTARQQFLLGRHSNAASSYEAALRAGADPASTNQRIGQSYANAGLNTQAANAYRKAISAYESALNGPGDKSHVKSALEACRRALKTLGG